MFFGNSRIVLGKNASDPVVGEWKAVAPVGAVNGNYGVTGNAEVFALEWVVSRDILMVGGRFEDIISGTTKTSANSIAKFDAGVSGWSVLTGLGGATAGVRNISVGSNTLGEVATIRDIRNSSDTHRILIGGGFNFAGGIYGSTNLNIVQYSIDGGWTGSAQFAADDRVYGISNIEFDSSGVTAYIVGKFANVQTTEFSVAVARYNFTVSSGVGQLTGLGDDFSVAFGADGIIWAAYNDTVDDKLILQYNIQRIRFGYDATYDLIEDVNIVQGANGVIDSDLGPFPKFLLRSTTNNRYLYSSSIPIEYYDYNKAIWTTWNGSPTNNHLISSFDAIPYNSGTYLVAGINEDYEGFASTKNLMFYKIDDNSFQTKSVPMPDELSENSRANINAVVIDQNTGVVYVGGKFAFRDSDGNTAWNVAKFVPSAIKFTPS